MFFYSNSSSMDIDEENQNVSFNPEDFVPLIEKMLGIVHSFFFSFFY